jgi:hypothetical protein
VLIYLNDNNISFVRLDAYFYKFFSYFLKKNSMVFNPEPVRSCGICGDTRAGFLRVLRRLLPLTPFIAPHSPSSIIPGWKIGQIVAEVPSGLSLTETKR